MKKNIHTVTGMLLVILFAGAGCTTNNESNILPTEKEPQENIQKKNETKKEVTPVEKKPVQTNEQIQESVSTINMNKNVPTNLTNLLTQTLSIGISSGITGKMIGVVDITGEKGPAIIKVDGIEDTMNIGETKIINGQSITLLRIVPKICKRNGIEKKGTECGINPYRAEITTQN